MYIDKLNKLIEPAVASLGFELVGCEQIASGQQPKLRVYIDKQAGVTVDDCAEVSRQIDAMLAVEAPQWSETELEVSSPGIDRPLFSLAQFEQFIGQIAKVKLKVPDGERKRFKGTIEKVEGQQVTLLVEGEHWQFAMSNIERANLSPDI